MKHTDINQSLVNSFLGETVRTNDYYGCLRICEVIYQFFYVQISISQAANFWKWKHKDAFKSPFSVEESEIANTFVEYLEHVLHNTRKQSENDQIVSKWSDIFNDVKAVKRNHNDQPQHSKPVCPECGLDLSKPLGYVCPSTKCPTGLSGPSCKM